MWSHITCAIGVSGLISLFTLLVPATGFCGIAPNPDVNRDGNVSATDLALVGRCVGQDPNTPPCVNTDVDLDGDVDLNDVQLVAAAMRTRQPTATRTRTATRVPTGTATATATATMVSVPTATGTPSRTATRTGTFTPTATETGTFTVTATASATSTASRTATVTRTATSTPAPTFTPPATHTSTLAPTSTPPATATASHTPSAEVPDTLPTEPSDLAPPADSGVAASIADTTKFLYSGPNPIQTGVAPATIDPARVAVLRGRVLTRDEQPLAGVAVTILNHPEYGQTHTRENGMFDMAVNGGGQLTVSYSRTGFLPAQRQIDAPWQNFAILPEVVLIPLDPLVTAVDLTANVPFQVARGSMVTDSDGTRQATLLFPQGTSATMVFPNGTMQPISALNVRATEYTVGHNGPNAMPAELPATSGYTYCVELSIDEAIAAGAEVRFSAPVPFYVENFLGFPIGIDVPVGSYDRTRGVWVPEQNGKVIKILNVSGGMADVDSNGDGVADDATLLAALAITDAERQQLATLYTAGQSLWRALVTHFTPWDCNWPLVAPPDAEFPPDDPESDELLDEACEESGNSVIECENQILGETVGVVGTEFALHYRSDRAAGYRAAYTLEIPITRDIPPPGVVGIDVDIEVAGRRFEREFPVVPNQRFTFTWDGRDAYGRTLDGPQPITVGISYTYLAVYAEAAYFGAPGGTAIVIVPSRQEAKLKRIAPMYIGSWRAPSAGLGGWTLSAHHGYVPSTKVLYRGDGRRESSAREARGPIITAVTAVAGSCLGGADGVPAIGAKVCPEGVAVGPDGSVYVAAFDHRVRRIGPDGIITTVAGNGTVCNSSTAPCGDGGPATQAQLNRPWGVAVGPDNSIYISEILRDRIRKVDPNGMITTVVGTGVECPSPFIPCGDGGLGTLAQLHDPLDLDVGPDNALYIADTFNSRIRRLGPDGIITTVAGTGTPARFPREPHLRSVETAGRPPRRAWRSPDPSRWAATAAST